MAAVKNPQQLLADKEAYYESVTRWIRWLAIGLVILTFPPSHPYYPLLLFTTAIAVGFNALRYSRLMHWRVFRSRITTLVADTALIGVLVGLSGGNTSPYFIFWAFTLISAAYWYGRRGITLILIWQIGVSLLLMSWHNSYSATGPLNLAVAELASLIILALLAERLTHADRNERVVLSSANREVEAARQRMSALINSMADGVIAIDGSQRITLYNGAALDLLNTNRALTGQPIEAVLDVIDTKGNKVHLASFLTHPGVVKRNDWVLRLGEDSSINLDVSVSPIHINQQEDDGHILLLRDITKQKTLDQERDEFISVTSHELRTPVAIAEANLSTALLPAFAKLEPKVKGLLEQAHENIVFLGQLIKDLSTLSRAERGLLKVDISPVDPVQLIDQLGSDYKASAQSKGIDLRVEHSVELKPIQSSLNLIHEIMQNFITNALKYTEKGSVTLKAEPGPGNHGVVLSVTDTGIGISVADQKQLFSKFFRSEDYRTRQTNGTGLGLYITKRLAQRMGGEIWVKSKLNQGSTFSVSIPAHPALKTSGDSSAA